MRIFVDTEFTSFSDPRLIALGAALEEPLESTASFYGVLTDFPVKVCTPFVVGNVLPLLEVRASNVRGTRRCVADAFSDWLRLIDDPKTGIDILADDEVDLHLISELLQLAASGPAPQPPTLLLRVKQSAGVRESFSRYFLAHPERHRHNALDDALALRYAIACNPVPSPGE